MASTYTNNWINNKGRDVEATQKLVEKLNKKEEIRIKNGWRWFKISERTRVLVPFDRRGKPTEEGLRMIENAKKICD